MVFRLCSIYTTPLLSRENHTRLSGLSFVGSSKLLLNNIIKVLKNAYGLRLHAIIIIDVWLFKAKELSGQIIKLVNEANKNQIEILKLKDFIHLRIFDRTSDKLVSNPGVMMEKRMAHVSSCISFDFIATFMLAKRTVEVSKI